MRNAYEQSLFLKLSTAGYARVQMDVRVHVRVPRLTLPYRTLPQPNVSYLI